MPLVLSSHLLHVVCTVSVPALRWICCGCKGLLKLIPQRYIQLSLQRKLSLCGSAKVRCCYCCWCCCDVGKIAPEYSAGCELNVGGSVVSSALRDVCGVSRQQLRELYSQHGDLGDVAQVRQQRFAVPRQSVAEGVHIFQQMSGRQGLCLCPCVSCAACVCWSGVAASLF